MISITIFLNIVDRGTRYGIRCRVSNISADTMKTLLKTRWFLEFGAPISFSEDPEFTGDVMGLSCGHIILRKYFKLVVKLVRAFKRTG